MTVRELVNMNTKRWIRKRKIVKEKTYGKIISEMMTETCGERRMWEERRK